MEILNVGQRYKEEVKEVEVEEERWHLVCFIFILLVMVFYGEVMENDQAAGDDGDDDGDQKAVNIEDTVY